jgi:hypothetical protein
MGLRLGIGDGFLSNITLDHRVLDTYTPPTIRKAKLGGAAAMSSHLNELLGYQVHSTAAWRRGKAEQFPNDPRNLKAAEELERLAEQIEKLDGSEIHKLVREIANTFNATDNGDGWLNITEEVSDELRYIGFHSSYDTGEQFLKWFCDLLEKEHRGLVERELSEIDDAVPASELSELAANDPAVQAAKQAYDAAVAKAYAEARKKNL